MFESVCACVDERGVFGIRFSVASIFSRIVERAMIHVAPCQCDTEEQGVPKSLTHRGGEGVHLCLGFGG